MIEVVYDFTDAHGEAGRLLVRGGIWAGDECVFEFVETLRGTSGTARCDWRRPAPHLEVRHGDGRDPAVRRVLQQLGDLLLPFHSGAFAGVSDAALAELYAGSYHADQNYSNGHRFETWYKGRIVDSIVRLLAPRKLLDAGCSAGEVVRQLRARGVDAHGFDLCADLDDIAYPEVRDFVRRGSVTTIPFGPEHGFDTLTAFDVFEHIPEDRIPAMVDEFARLGVRTVVALIAQCEFQYKGHLTLRPLTWWDRALAPRFRRRHDARTLSTMARDFAGDPGKYLAVYDLVEVPALSA
ncbi:MAG: class I SAM-dependent methyltransferase [Planctomycetes bacterium]|nr:class I SAM-dependent methyltransferase [Planctomycetota bacterium]